MSERCPIELSELTACMREALGNGFTAVKAKRLHGGAQKTVYLVQAQNGFKLMFYIWDLKQNYFEEEVAANYANGEQGSFGAELFRRNNQYLIEQGVRTPALYAMDSSQEKYPFDFALVEYVSGGDLLPYLEHPSEALRDQVFGKCNELLRSLHQIKRSSWGKVWHPADRYSKPCETGIYDNAIIQLDFLAGEVSRVAQQHERLLDVLEGMRCTIVPRAEYSLIHSELGPDHILLNESLEPYFIDIEGAEFFDLEYEHSFLQFRFPNYEQYLSRDDLDEQRLRFYRFCHHISCASGGLKLLQRGFPDRQLAMEIHASNLAQTLSYT
ncbi:phosphotransferase family protein [Paenibacillus sp. CF384]|uniref:phosphotransferase family protein n=1 Tax=Paenibacillus sp. CF384 TaxID=1884382 RepID=UPI0008966502|nr:phosphotransferase [Paenibacillus sp. CF384]SDW45089.1 Phosphotransferase enzyme family protein [Paenibacillus sp. CF384]